MTTRIETMRLELRRGTLALAVLQSLQQEHYGYSLRKLLLQAGLDVEEGTLYPLIRRLESYGLLESRWSEGEGRRRRYYRISEEGKQTLDALSKEWRLLNDALKELRESKT
ncbi:MAG: PadR family transcriptional regulator [Gammaproteobacteria bacterium]|nr:PadR family transcriptional regulator [Pseudomonadales bacterium]MCP5348829.1 PadR family transcriptional regulator [Pseudomonadales bacterium]